MEVKRKEFKYRDSDEAQAFAEIVGGKLVDSPCVGHVVLWVEKEEPRAIDQDMLEEIVDQLEEIRQSLYILKRAIGIR